MSVSKGKLKRYESINPFLPSIYNKFNGRVLETPPLDVATSAVVSNTLNVKGVDTMSNTKLYMVITVISTVVTAIAEAIKQIFC